MIRVIEELEAIVQRELDTLKTKLRAVLHPFHSQVDAHAAPADVALGQAFAAARKIVADKSDQSVAEAAGLPAIAPEPSPTAQAAGEHPEAPPAA